MALNPIHNALFLAANLLRAETVALKLLPDAATNWDAVDVAVGDTAQLAGLGWESGTLAPQLIGYDIQTLDLFGISASLNLYKHPTRTDWAASINVSDALLQAMPGQFLFHERRNVQNFTLGTLWLGLGCGEQTIQVTKFQPESELEQLFELALGVTTQILWGLYHNHQVNADATTGLQGIAECRNQVTQLVRRRQSSPGGIACYMIGIDDYHEVKQHKGTSVLDEILRTTARQLQSSLRSGDGCYRYSEAIFAVLVQIPDNESAAKLAIKLQQQLRASDVGDTVTYSIGYIFQPNETAGDPLRLTMCAELALGQAKSRGRSQLEPFSNTLDPLDVNYKDTKLSLITADPARDHRNSRLLWQTISLFADESDAQTLCASFTSLVHNSLGLNSIKLLRETAGNLAPLTLLTDKPPTHFNAKRTLLAQQALQFKKTITTSKNLGDGYWLATPFLTRDNRKGCLFVERAHGFDTADQLLLKALADQLAGALDRIELVYADQQESEKESSELKAELRTLRNVPRSNALDAPGQLIARSHPMKQVIEYADKIAATEAPILILGGKGTGKTLLANHVHANSGRRENEIRTLDCLTVAPTELYQALFGHIDGELTSSDSSKAGKLAAANGGTLLIDEVGALPLDAQLMLLDYLLNGRYAPAATNSSVLLDADTRIICTTNRDLLQDVEGGHFSEQLYQRLQFVQLKLPALSERTADIPVLIKYFLVQCNAQLGKTVDTLTESAWARLMNHDWPGNVQELKLAILQACVTSRANQIDLQDLRFLDLAPIEETAPVEVTEVATNTSSRAEAVAIDTNNPDSWALLSNFLGQQIQQLLTASQYEAPIGRWLADSVVLSAAEVNQYVARRAAKLLGVPETTLRRQLRKAQQNADNPFQVTSQEWLADQGNLRTLLTRIMSEPQADPEQNSLADQFQSLVLAEITRQVGENRKLGAALMGVTPPTYSRWLERYGITLESVEVDGSATSTDHHLIESGAASSRSS